MPEAIALAEQVEKNIRRQRVLALMLGDTSMGMINGYFGPRLLYPIGFAEHKVDQAWLIERTKAVSRSRVDDAFRFVQDRGVTFHWERKTPRLHRVCDPRAASRLPGRSRLGRRIPGRLRRLAIPARIAQLASAQRLCRRTLEFARTAEGNGHVVITSTEADQGNLVPMELMKRLLEAKGLPGAVMFHDVRWGARQTVDSSGFS